MPTDTKTKMTPDHKAALAEGRTQSKAVKAYLEALEAHRPKRGRKRSTEQVVARLDAIEHELEDAEANPLTRLRLAQERIDLHAWLDAEEEEYDISALEAEFVAVAKAYSERKDISYEAWRELGVKPAVLRNAGITR